MTPLQLAHRAYLQSSTWKDIRAQVLIRDNNKCTKCNNLGYDAHHLTYENWGCELLSDLTTLCRTCHEQFHQIEGATKECKGIGTRAIFAYLTESQKTNLQTQFNLDNNQLYYSIYMCPDPKVCNAAIKLINYKRWYPQLGDNRYQPKTKQEIKNANKQYGKRQARKLRKRQWIC